MFRSRASARLWQSLRVQQPCWRVRRGPDTRASTERGQWAARAPNSAWRARLRHRGRALADPGKLPGRGGCSAHDSQLLFRRQLLGLPPTPVTSDSPHTDRYDRRVRPP